MKLDYQRQHMTSPSHITCTVPLSPIMEDASEMNIDYLVANLTPPEKYSLLAGKTSRP